MPEHGAGTPAHLCDLESFLWHDFEGGSAGWNAWLRRVMPQIPGPRGGAMFNDAMRLHTLLRGLQAANSGIAAGEPTDRSETLDRLVTRYGIRPYLAEGGSLHLVSGRAGDPVATLMLTALDALQSAAWRRFKLCRDPACRASYYDASKAAAKTWCSMQTCGSRDKMRRYRSRM